MGIEILWSLTAVLAVCALMPLCGERRWLGDLFSHFRFHYLVLGAVVLSLAVLVREWWIAVLAPMLLVTHITAILKPRYAKRASSADLAGKRLTVVSINVQSINRTLKNAVSFVQEAHADVVLIQELNRRWHDQFATLRRHFPHVAPHNWRESPQNIVLSRLPISSNRLHVGKSPKFNFVEAQIVTEDGAITIIGVHPPYPMSARLFALQQDQITRLARVSAESKNPVIVAGDFNLTPYSPRFWAMLKASRLYLARHGTLWPRTWPTGNRLRLSSDLVPGIPIDNILVSHEFRVVAFRRGQNVGSDHYPIVAEIVDRRRSIKTKLGSSPNGGN